MFPKGISLKVNVIVQLEFELPYFEATGQNFNYYGIALLCKCILGYTNANIGL